MDTLHLIFQVGGRCATFFYSPIDLCPEMSRFPVFRGMRMCALRLLFFLFSLFAFSQVDVDAQTRVVRRLGDVRSIYVDRDSFDIADAPCGKRVNGVWEPCNSVKKKRLKFLDALERWIGKYGIKVAKDAASADAVLRGLIPMSDHQLDYDPTKLRNRSRGDILEAEDLEDWHIEAWLESPTGATLWESGTVDAPKPAYGFSTVGKIEAKELVKEIEYSIRKDR